MLVRSQEAPRLEAHRHRMARIGIDARYLENEITGVGRYSYNLITHLLEEDKKNAEPQEIEKE